MKKFLSGIIIALMMACGQSVLAKTVPVEAMTSFSATNPPDTMIVYTIGAFILAILGVASCILIFKGLREHPENRTYMPFGPAMVVAALIALMV